LTPEVCNVIELDGHCVHIETSPVQFARPVGPTHQDQRLGSFDAPRPTSVRLAVPPD
jgi:hypothetical protein